MADKCKIYSKDYILSILKNKFTIKNLKEEYTTKDKLELICNDCDIECTKNIGNKFNGECRNCNMKKSHYNKIDSEVKMYPEIISWKRGIAYTLVTFKCIICSKESEKMFGNFKKNKRCTNCVSREVANNRCQEENKNILINILNENNIEYKPFEKQTIYNDIEVKCSECCKFHISKIYTVKNKCLNDGKFLCNECTLKRKQKTSTYNLVKFYKNNKELGDKTGFLYFYNININGVEACKMGITRNDVMSRVPKSSKIYEISNIRYIKDTNLNVAIRERELKNKYKEFKILPEIKFEGYTECFTIPIDIKENMKVQRLEL